MSLWSKFVENFVPPQEDLEELGSRLDRFKEWSAENGSWWAISGLVHAILLLGLVLIPFALPRHDEGPVLEAIPVFEDTTEIGHFDVGAAPMDPTELDTDTLTLVDPPAQEARYFDDSKKFEDAAGGTNVNDQQVLLGGLGGFEVVSTGPGASISGGGGIGGSIEAGDSPGNGGRGSGFGGRGQGMREEMLGAYGGTRASERAVAGALNWLYRHQLASGHWNLDTYTDRCKGDTCDGVGMTDCDAAATALALLPFLAAGQTHLSEGPYKKGILSGINYLVKNQAPDGDLSNQSGQRMYSHGLAAITMCEAWALSREPRLEIAAQKAINFIQNAQNKTTGGWRYQPGDEGDLSVTTWQVMALKSAQMAGLSVDKNSFELANKFIMSVAKGEENGLFAYQSFQNGTPAMTACGMLCRQYLGAQRNEPAMQEGRDYLMSNLPDNMFLRNSYYWYYATLTFHNFMGPEWDNWNRRMRRTLIESQVKKGCGSGSWDPLSPSPDAWGGQGGRLATTSLCTLTLEVYYRYLPLYKPETLQMQAQPLEQAAAK